MDFLKMRWTFRSRLFLGSLFLFLSACVENGSTVSENFVNAYIELRVVSREYGEISPDGRIARTEVLKKYGYTRASFEAEAENIKRDPDLWEPFQIAAVARIDSLVGKHTRQRNEGGERHHVKFPQNRKPLHDINQMHSPLRPKKEVHP
ncbi:MAG: hypothetical protein AUK31_06530 [Fibrobacteres bacterium CG2_30_45_31]|nr:MAG: hypothetical protein AUK31_06530 [Fibrobacteres bacterium CG2_30_45_31]